MTPRPRTRIRSYKFFDLSFDIFLAQLPSIKKRSSPDQGEDNRDQR